MTQPITLVVSQGQSNHPDKRGLEQRLAERLAEQPGVDVLVVPNLYDLKPDGATLNALRQVEGDLVVLSWLYPRAAHWTLDRNGVRGRVGESLLVAEDDDDDDEDEDDWDEEEAKTRVADERGFPDRTIYCIDLRCADDPRTYVEELTRIRAELVPSTGNGQAAIDGWLRGEATAEQMRRFAQPANDTHLDAQGRLAMETAGPGAVVRGQETHAQPGQETHAQPGQESRAQPGTHAQPGQETRAQQAETHAQQAQPERQADVALPFSLDGGPLRRVDEQAGRRWYPVIDFSRCTNCMECIDFCLFGVYGIDGSETILVEQPDNCRKGCPACSRVCPENAIIFPQHKTPAIAGAEVALGGLKIDLSKLFGAPDTGEDAVDVAARERDEQLLLAGREAVGASVGIPKRQAENSEKCNDELDNLIDALDELEL